MKSRYFYSMALLVIVAGLVLGAVFKFAFAGVPETQAATFQQREVTATDKELQILDIRILPTDISPQITRSEAIEIVLRNHFEGAHLIVPLPRTHTGAGAVFGLVSDLSQNIIDVPAWIVTVKGVPVPPASTGIHGLRYKPTGTAISIISDATGLEVGGGILTYPE